MIDIDKLESAIKTMRSLKNDLVKFKRMSTKRGESSLADCTQKRIQKMEADLNWLAMSIDKQTHYAHVAVVEAGLARPYEDDYYITITHRPSSFHEYNFKRERPKT